jgi:hypothetical protein
MYNPLPFFLAAMFLKSRVLLPPTKLFILLLLLLSISRLRFQFSRCGMCFILLSARFNPSYTLTREIVEIPHPVVAPGAARPGVSPDYAMKG